MLNVSTVTTEPKYLASCKMLRAIVTALITSETELWPLLTSSLSIEIVIKKDQEFLAAAIKVWRSC